MAILDDFRTFIACDVRPLGQSEEGNERRFEGLAQVWYYRIKGFRYDLVIETTEHVAGLGFRV